MFPVTFSEFFQLICMRACVLTFGWNSTASKNSQPLNSFTSLVMLPCVYWWILTDVSKRRIAFNFRVKQFKGDYMTLDKGWWLCFLSVWWQNAYSFRCSFSVRSYLIIRMTGAMASIRIGQSVWGDFGVTYQNMWEYVTFLHLQNSIRFLGSLTTFPLPPSTNRMMVKRTFELYFTLQKSKKWLVTTLKSRQRVRVKK